MFEPLTTARLTIRSFELDDIDALLTRRNDPEVAQFQTWTIPYTREQAEATYGDATLEPEDGKWWTGTVILNATGEVVGDVVIHLTWQGRSGEIGYTLAREHWGNGYAVEAAQALVAYLFEVRRVTRVLGMLHPDNPASAMVLERVGMLFEGHTRLSYWVGDENSDDWIYGMTRSDWEAWRDRPRNRPEIVELVEVTVDNAWDVYKLRTHKTQERFVATMADSYADALFPDEEDGATVVPWLRAVRADGELVGFVMMTEVTEHHPDGYLWRFLIDRIHQHRGIGKMALSLLEEECRKMGTSKLYTSWVEGKGSPREFYLRNGFELTGEIEDGETVGLKYL